ncbi:MAG: amidohydrolase family protein [Hyphomonadaceae bacterium]
MLTELKTGAMIGILLTLTNCQTPPTDSNATLYHGFSRIDPDREAVIEGAWIVVEGEKIREIGAGAPPLRKYSNTRDMSGHYALPGFIDAHAHMTAGPHKIEIRDGAPAATIESVDEITQFNARIALAFGATTVRNPAGDPEANARYDANIANGVWIGPESFHAGAAIQPPPFAGNAFAYPQSVDEWRMEASRQAALGMKYFKLYVSLTEEELAAGIQAAHEQGLKAIAHLDSVSWTRAAELGIDGLEHALPTSPDLLEPTQRADYIAGLGPDSKHTYRWFELVDFDGPLFQHMVDLLVRNQVQTNMTLVVNELTYNTDKLSDVWPLADRKFEHPDNLEAGLSFLQASGIGWEEEDFSRARAVMPKVLEFARRLHEAGVPMMLGTDSRGGTPFYAREMALHVEAGISKWAVLRMATSESAELLEIADRTGRISNGMEADIVFLSSNPMTDIYNVRNVAFVITNGREYAFDTLIEESVGSLGHGIGE